VCILLCVTIICFGKVIRQHNTISVVLTDNLNKTYDCDKQLDEHCENSSSEFVGFLNEVLHLVVRERASPEHGK
jgi:hypothetical protein